jgi:heme-degrading monooxygenase HmoA
MEISGQFRECLRAVGTAVLVLSSFGCGAGSREESAGASPPGGSSPGSPSPSARAPIDQSKVALEVILIDMADGGSEADQRAFDNRVQDIVKAQPGFIKRVSAYGRREPISASDTPKRRFFITVFWDSIEHANAAAAAFTSNPISKEARPGTKPGMPDLYAHYVIGDSTIAGSEVPADALFDNPALALEVIAFDIADAASVPDLLAKDMNMDRTLISKQPGYLKRLTAVGKNELTQKRQYFITVFWKSLDDAMKAAAIVTKDPGSQVLYSFMKADGMMSYNHFYDGLKMVK